MPTLDSLQDLTETQRRVLEGIEREPTLTQTFYLTGGTLLKAVGIAPRRSDDLDFFTFPAVESLTYTQRLVRMREVLTGLFGNDAITETDRGFLHTASKTVIDVVADRVKAIDSFVPYGNLQTVSLKDLAASKASALCSRDEVKDYLDIAFLTKRQGWLLRDLAGLAEEKFGLGTVSEERLLTELLAKRDLFRVPPDLFIRNADENLALIHQQVAYLLEHTSV